MPSAFSVTHPAVALKVMIMMMMVITVIIRDSTMGSSNGRLGSNLIETFKVISVL